MLGVFNKNPKKPLPSGFTILELILAIFVILVGILGSYSLVAFTISTFNLSNLQLTGAYLSQEGIEIVRNIRDANWLASVQWNQGLGPGDWEADYNDTQLVSWTGQGRFLNLDSLAGFYNYNDGGTATNFKRKITIASTASDIINVTVRVSWEAKGKTYSITAAEDLYNWYPQ